MSYDNYSPTGAPYTPPSSTMAIVSLIAGLLGLTILPTIGSIIALITGYMAKNEIRASGGALGGDGMATAGTILGWIGVALTVIGLCVVCVLVLLPMILIPLGLSLDGYNWLLPALLNVF